jgi:pimeloyl-ACP methyl ester carboxylesterase
LKLAAFLCGCIVPIVGLLAGCQNEPVTDAAELRATMQIPHFRNELRPRVDSTWTRRDLVFERVRFQGRYRDWIPAIACYSELGRTHPLPAILCMPGSPNRKEDLLRPLDLLPRWAEAGFYVVSIDRPYHGERQGDLNTAIYTKGLAKVWGEYVYDLMRALDYLETRQEVDPARIGMLGLSMGGMEALLVAALDERVRVVVSVAGQLSWPEIFAAGAWKGVFPGLRLRHELVRSGVNGKQAFAAFRSEYPELTTIDAAKVGPMIAPRPLLLMIGEEDPLIPQAAAQRTFEAARRVYRRHNQVNNLELRVVASVGHSFPPGMQSEALEWFGRWL